MRTAIFDLDGTLADTSRDLIAAANACFHDLGMGSPLDPVSDAATAFRGGRAMLTLGFARVEGVAPVLIDQEYPKLLAHYAAGIDVHTILYPGAVEAVDRLRQQGIATGICTNKPEALARELLKRLGVADLFDCLVGGDTLPVRKPDPAPLLRSIDMVGGRVDLAVLIGDTETDRRAAAAAGTPCVLVAFGPEGSSIASLEPDALLDHYDQLEDVVLPLFGKQPRPSRT
ncbi:MAG: HAD-IA family hydrolase [Pseudomonadota bacterium]